MLLILIRIISAIWNESYNLFLTVNAINLVQMFDITSSIIRLYVSQMRCRI